MPSFTDKAISGKSNNRPAASPAAPPVAASPTSSDAFNPAGYPRYFESAMISAVLVDPKEIPLTKEAISCQPLAGAKLEAMNATILKLRPQGR